MTLHFQELAKCICADPKIPIANLDYQPQEEQIKLLDDFNKPSINADLMV